MFQHPRHLSLRGKLLLASILVEVIMLALLVGNSMRLTQTHMERLTQSGIESVELAYKTAVAPPLASRDYATLRDILDGWRKAEDILYLVVTDTNGRVLAASGLASGQALPPSGPDSGGAPVTHVRFAVDYLDQVYGHVQYGLSTEAIQTAKREVVTQGSLIALAEITLTIVLLSVIGYWLTRHLSSLMAASGRIAQGDYATRLKVDSDDEIARLAGHFNLMADAVQERINALSRNEERSRAIADFTYGWENWFAPDGHLNWVNPAVERVSGYAPEECHAMADFPLPIVFGDDLDLVSRCHRRGLSGQTGQDQEFRIRRKDGRTIWVAMSWQPIFDDQGQSLGYRSSIRDISLEHYAKEELAYQASHDTLTGLYNRRAFEQYVQSVLDSQGPASEPRTLLYIDLDQFKLVNDTCGHSAGDRLLREITVIMQRTANHGYLARLGGDEFGLLLDCDLECAIRQSEKLIDAIHSHTFVYEGQYFQLGASVGVVEMRQTHMGIDELLIAADQACYAAKDKGRNRVEVFAPEDDYYRSQRAQFLSASEITRGLRENRLLLYVQRVKPLHPDLPDHAEILVRMRDERGEVLSPARFIPAAERFNLMTTIDQWVIDHACALLGRLGPEHHTATTYAVNLSGNTLSSDDLTDYVTQCIQRHGVEPRRVCFEITETAAVASMEKAQDFIQAMHRLGCSVALDDFGAGLSSFAYLRRLEADYLKIDALFVRNLDQDVRDQAVVKSIMEVARVHGMKTIAEFVHTPEIAQMLEAMGVDYAQGYAIHMPEAFHDSVSP